MKLFLKGLWIGGTMTVPGVSGGTMAAVVGIYEKLILALAEWRQKPRENTVFLLKFVAGALIGFLGFARIVTWLLEQPGIGLGLRIVFCAIVLGSVPFLVKQSGIQGVRFRDVAEVVAGAVIVLGISLLPAGLFSSGDGVMAILMQLLGGVIVAAALILPGISVSHMLYILGLYQPVLEKVYSFQILALLPLLLGAVLGCALTTRLMKYLLEHRKQDVYMVIIGFVAASVVSLLR